MAGVTKEQIFEAADKLVAEGMAATLTEVRRVLGTGSYSTISSAMQEWRAQQQAPTAPIKEPAPAAVVERLELLGQEIWTIALGIANDRLKSEREALEVARLEMEEQQRETAEMADQLALEIEQLRDDGKTLRFELEVAKQAEETARQMWQLEQDEVLKLRVQTEELQRHVASLQADNEGYRVALATAAERDRADQERFALRDREQGMEIERLNADNRRLADEVQRLAAERDEARSDCREAVDASTAAQIDASKLQGEIDALRDQLQQQADLIRTAMTKSTSRRQPTKSDQEKK